MKDGAAHSQPLSEVGALFRRSATERHILSLIQRAGGLPSAEIARLAEVSAQSASVITRALEADGLILKGDPVRGKVGKPLTPFTLNKDGAYSVGLRIGRRSADMILLDLAGGIRGHINKTYPFPTPTEIMAFARASMEALTSSLGAGGGDRIVGIGVGAPFELWNWLDATTTPKADMMAWRGFSFEAAFAAFTRLPVLVGNDASMACAGEHMFGDAAPLSDFAYFYVGAFVGGGVVLKDRLYTGPGGNAGAFGSLPVRQSDGSWGQLISQASLVQLEDTLEAQRPGRSLDLLRRNDWTGFEDLLAPWLQRTTEALAHAAISAVAMFDVPQIVIDCSAPPEIRAGLVEGTASRLADVDMRGLTPPQIRAGALGPMAGALGAGYQPIVATLLAD